MHIRYAISFMFTSLENHSSISRIYNKVAWTYFNKIFQWILSLFKRADNEKINDSSVTYNNDRDLFCIVILQQLRYISISRTLY